MASPRLKMAAAMFKSYFPCRSFSVFLRSPLVCARKKIEATESSKQSIQEPKCPAKPFFLFMKDKTQDVTKQNPNLSVIERTRMLTEMWKNLPQSGREKYLSLYQILFEKYRNDMYVYYQEVKKLSNSAARTIPIKRSLLKAFKERLGKPTSPPNALLKFAMDYAQKSGKTYKVPESFHEAREIWKQLPESERNRYKEEAKLEWLKYENELFQWEKKMLEDGHDILVRAKSLKMTKNLTAIDPLA